MTATKQYTRSARIHIDERVRQALRDGTVESQDTMTEISLRMPGADLGTLMDCANDGIEVNGTPEEALAVLRMGGLVVVNVEDMEESDERTVH